MRLKIALVFVLIFLLFSFLVVAVKPTQVSTGEVGLEIRYPQAEALKLNQDSDLNIHVFNKSDGLPMTNDTTSCFFEIFNSSGSHQTQSFLEFEGSASGAGDFHLKIESGNFSTFGFHTFLIQCNTTNIGGFVSGSVEVTLTGELPTGDNTGGIAIVLFILTITLGLFLLPFFKEFSKEEITNLILKRGCWVIAIYLMMLNSAMVATISALGGLGLDKELFRYMWLFGTAGWIFMGFTVFKTILDVTKIWKKNIEEKRTGIKKDG